jgi:hypothetical protein
MRVGSCTLYMFVGCGHNLYAMRPTVVWLVGERIALATHDLLVHPISGRQTAGKAK